MLGTCVLTLGRAVGFNLVHCTVACLVVVSFGGQLCPDDVHTVGMGILNDVRTGGGYTSKTGESQCPEIDVYYPKRYSYWSR